jgi:putative addiction module component (TIGR02574 family)
MSAHFEQLAADAMKLPLKDRVRLAQRLISTLDENFAAETEAELEALWFTEAERRLEELRSGKVQGINGEDAFRKARKTLKG